MTEKSSPLLFELDSYNGNAETRKKNCDWPDCTEEALHRAPRSRTEIDSYRWFCREHIRGYNKSWNYFAGMTDCEVEADRRADTVWQRPTWPLGDGVPMPEYTYRYLREAFSFPFSDFEHETYSTWNKDISSEPELNRELKNAFAIFGMKMPVSTNDVKNRYKILVKRHHPDAAKHNADEERLKDINYAYQKILAFLEP